MGLGAIGAGPCIFIISNMAAVVRARQTLVSFLSYLVHYQRISFSSRRTFSKSPNNANFWTLALIFMSFYLQFDFTRKKPKNGALKKVFQMVINENILLSYPEFNKQKIRLWLVEFGSNGIPRREIFIDQNLSYLIKISNEKFQNKWKDHGLSVKDFKKLFDSNEVIKQWFEYQWKKFDRIVYNFSVDISNYMVGTFYNENDDDKIFEKYIETLIVFQGKKRKTRLKIWYSNENFNVFPIRPLRATGKLYISRGLLTLSNTVIKEMT